MPDLTITSSAEANGRIRYELGPGNWQSRQIPDIHNPGATTTLAESRMIDVVILGDGYTTASDFEDQLDDWLDEFFDQQVYETFAGAFRIRALFEPSSVAASADRNSFYRCVVNSTGTAMSTSGSWYRSSGTDNDVFRDRMFDAVASFGDVNLRRYPASLDIGNQTSAINNSTLRDVHRNLVVCMLVRTDASNNVSGIARHVPRNAPDDDQQVRVGFGANKVHEFSHALAFLSDEYINGRGSSATRVNNPNASVFALSNLTYDDQLDTVPWLHLSPWGRRRRQGAGDDLEPLVGWLWVGGAQHHGVWHSEYRCLMNGGHDNFAFTQVTSQDPTAEPDGTYTDGNGAGLRDHDHFCLWCQEVVAIRILEKTDALRRPGDPSDVTDQGTTWWSRWVDELRDNYWELFDVDAQIDATEQLLGGLTPGASGEPLWQSDLYVPPSANPTPARNPVPDVDDDEIYTLLL